MVPGKPTPMPSRSLAARQIGHQVCDLAQDAQPGAVLRGHLAARGDLAVLADAAREDLGPADVDADGVGHGARVRALARSASLRTSMSDRPYRVYRGGGPVEPRDDEPVLNLPVAPSPEEEVEAPPVGERRGPVILPPPGAPPEPPRPAQPFPAPPPPPAPPRRRRVRIRTVIAIGVPLILVLLLGWIVLGYLAFRSSVEEANARLEAFKPAVSPC